MKHACKKIRAQFTGPPGGGPPDPGALRAARTHALGCASCREFLIRTKLGRLLRTACAEEIPEPSASFFAGLRLRLAAAEQPGAGTLFRELFTRAGLRLAPAMAALVVCLSGSLAYVYSSTTGSSAPYGIEDIILFDQAQASTDAILFNISLEDR